jgi:hypothetical protein
LSNLKTAGVFSRDRESSHQLRSRRASRSSANSAVGSIVNSMAMTVVSRRSAADPIHGDLSIHQVLIAIVTVLMSA